MIFLKSIIDSSTIEFSVININENSQHVKLSVTSINRSNKQIVIQKMSMKFHLMVCLLGI